MAELAEVKAALSHVVPDGNLEALLRSCMQKTLELCGRRKRGARKARACSEANRTDGETAAVHPPETVTTPTSGPEVEAPAPAPIEPTGGSIRGGKRTRYVKAEVRRAVWERDGGACTFIGTNEKRCGSRYQVELDHVKPFAWGGPGTIDNLTLRCRAHNLHRAREHFGEEHMAKRSHRARPEPTGGLFEPLTVADPP
ncbi:MAG: HNH endonuclease signature motif containing protein, partial [Myxococcaceae bacterium]